MALSLAFAPPASARTDGKSASRKSKRSVPMQPGFSKAQASFRDHAARALKIPAADVLVSPVEEDASVQLDERVGRAWAFYGKSRNHPDQSVRGWAVADGTVITPDQNLGILFQEAGIWSAAPALDAAALAKRLVWAMGANHRVKDSPKLVLDATGAGALTFEDAYRPSGPGGAGGGPERLSRITVKLTADHKAELARSAVAKPAAPVFE